MALDAGAVALPQGGRVLLLRPPEDVELPAGDVVAATGFKPVHDRLAARGVAVGPDPVPADAAVVFLPRAKAMSRDLIAQAIDAVPEGAPVVVDGAKTDGADAVLKLCRAIAPVGEVFSKAHGKCFAFPAPASAPPGWRAEATGADGFATAPGTFSAGGVDPGSRALADAMPPLSGAVCDLGAGWGYLAARLLQSPAVASVDLVESEHAALSCARRNVDDPRARFHWADATTWDGGPYDAVVTNPPFHQGRAADPSLGRAFIDAATRILAPRGRLWMVANRHLPYEATLRDRFAEIVVHRDGGGYKIVEGSPKPNRGKRR